MKMLKISRNRLKKEKSSVNLCTVFDSRDINRGQIPQKLFMVQQKDIMISIPRKFIKS